MKRAAATKGVEAVRAQFNRQKESGLSLVDNAALADSRAAAQAVLREMAEVDLKKVVAVPLSRVIDNPYNARHVYPQGRVDELVESIKEKGQMSPAHAFPIPDREGYWQLVDGKFRKTALMLCGNETIDILPVSPCSEFELYHLSYLLNNERSPQTAFDNAFSWKKLLEDGLVQDQESLAKALNISKGTVSKTLSVLDLHEDIIQLVKGQAEMFGPAMCYALFQYSKAPGKSIEEVKDLFWEIVDKGLSTREVDRIREQAESTAGPRVREHSTTYPLTLEEGVRASLKEWSRQGRLSLDIRNLSEKRRVAIRQEILRILEQD